MNELINAENGLDLLDFGLRIAAAMAAGIIMGVEREFKGKSAGLKTQTLVAIGAAVFVFISLVFADAPNVDITRVLSQVIIGIGFLGGGVILQKGDRVEGLTTAATVWCSAAAGCLSAVGMFAELALLTVVVLVINVIFDIVDRRIEEKTDED
ncbi:MgtC/SapB family protein [Zeaxanthinibacter enoshimensis]|uniref:Putative Mg2+ transporter-C (MgtC) family protein n=1 Tax=Zeaxanthinibacter enoshimensis TaxID=392009 RepID=A0A4R6TQY9_9FLAO|nr:MgtC/SapB family protein [Zeaxanthinibacter enoshimensis]TDQ30910.1 putative Mg2+ transporter-C (MgtC) family protein [Zeaxanthinibacter enoshimensis]